MDVKILKQELEQYVKSNGIKYRYIAQQINVNESVLCNWRKDRRNLTQQQLQELQNLIRG